MFDALDLFMFAFLVLITARCLFIIIKSMVELLTKWKQNK